MAWGILKWLLSRFSSLSSYSQKRTEKRSHDKALSMSPRIRFSKASTCYPCKYLLIAVWTRREEFPCRTSQMTLLLRPWAAVVGREELGWEGSAVKSREPALQHNQITAPATMLQPGQQLPRSISSYRDPGTKNWRDPFGKVVSTSAGRPSCSVSQCLLSILIHENQNST